MPLEQSPGEPPCTSNVSPRTAGPRSNVAALNGETTRLAILPKCVAAKSTPFASNTEFWQHRGNPAAGSGGVASRPNQHGMKVGQPELVVKRFVTPLAAPARQSESRRTR